MRVIMLTWEFPPRVVGQLAYYVNALAAELVKKNVDVFVVPTTILGSVTIKVLTE